MVTLRYLATGESFSSLALNFRLGISTIHYIVGETCEVIKSQLARDYLRTPTTTDEWLAISKDFWNKWQCPNTLGKQSI
jgi:hypothetical protein